MVALNGAFVTNIACRSRLIPCTEVAESFNMSGPSNTQKKSTHKIESSCEVQDIEQLVESFVAPLVLHDEVTVSSKALGKRKASPYMGLSTSKASLSKKIKKLDHSAAVEAISAFQELPARAPQVCYFFMIYERLFNLFTGHCNAWTCFD